MVRTWYEEGAREKEVFSCTINSLYSWFLSLFYRKKEKQKKLAAADKYAKIMILSLNKIVQTYQNSLNENNILKQGITARILMRLYSLKQLFVLNASDS